MPRTWLLTDNNRDLKRDGIFTWSLPALAVKLPDGTNKNVCPAAGVCANLCYARQGTYRIPSVAAAHLRNLLLTMDVPRFEALMTEEVQHPRYSSRWVRIHDGGDFHSEDYLRAWLRICAAAPRVNFYCYTKEVRLFKVLVEGHAPANFRWCYSLGGKEDRLIEPGDRVADVFPDEPSIGNAGYSSQAASDLLAVTGPPLVGMAANNIRALRKRQGPYSFGELQAARDRKHEGHVRAQAPGDVDTEPGLFGPR
jgi:Gene product 88